MIPVKGVSGARFAVLGLGRSGMAAVRALRAGGAEPVVWDDGPEVRVRAGAEGLTLANLRTDGAYEGVSALIVSPGIPHLYPTPHPAVRVAWAAGVPVDNDVGLFFRSLGQGAWQTYDRQPRVIAVTGSNGKSTTSALIHHVLTSAGIRTQLAGNIGLGVLDLDPPEDGAVIVLELSSYQIDLARALTPDVAVFTNLTPDHLDRHGGVGGYFAAKCRLFSEGGPDRAVIGVDEDEGRALAGQLAEGPGDMRVIRVSVAGKLFGPGWSVTVHKGWLREVRQGRQVGAIDLRGVQGLPGVHNHQNSACAYGALRALGVAPKVIGAGFLSFAGLPHRSQTVGQRDGIRFVNDSKATNVDAAARALASFTRIRWICGGLEKEGGLDQLAPALGTVAKAYVIGRDAGAFARKLEVVETEICTTMARAVARAAEEAAPGDTVLLAPAAASFDQYDNFEERGRDFINHVTRWLER
ncbi:MAG: UDP-N-acetylmuramoyl-L-alanine--D-glutamate ligase [Rhodobacteraceae bacterium]|nr:UDP-N-acetylmuramoyl-L-alanine--D-glutamate ligase [Paracoccaceae bacterium]